jgi:hypothetical protein
MNINYFNKINKYSEEELKEEEYKLQKLLTSLTQEHLDRECTISLVVSQLELVNTVRVNKGDIHV